MVRAMRPVPITPMVILSDGAFGSKTVAGTIVGARNAPAVTNVEPLRKSLRVSAGLAFFFFTLLLPFYFSSGTSDSTLTAGGSPKSRWRRSATSAAIVPS